MLSGSDLLAYVASSQMPPGAQDFSRARERAAMLPSRALRSCKEPGYVNRPAQSPTTRRSPNHGTQRAAYQAVASGVL